VHMSAVWLAPLGVGTVGALVVSALAYRLRRQVEELQKSMRPLRTGRDRAGHAR
jgi:hypothetical protein